MNATKVRVYKKVLQDICDKFSGTEEYVIERIEEIWSPEKLSVEEVIYLVYFVEGLCF